MNWFVEIEGDILERFDLYLNGEYRPLVNERKADDFYLVHTISSDNAQGAGFAKVLNDRYHFRDSLCADLAESFPGFGTDKWHFQKASGEFYRIPINPNYTLGEAQRMKFEGKIGSIYATERCPHIFGLVTKDHYYDKPTLDTMMTAIQELRKYLERVLFCGDDDMLIEVMMPHIGCGLDKLKWSDAKEILFDELHELGESGRIRVVAAEPPRRIVGF